jgi:hypothetical protein
MAEAPDLTVPFENDRERGVFLADLLYLTTQLDQWRDWSLNIEALSPGQRAQLASAVGPGDTPDLKLQRWITLFDDELRAVSDARNRAVHGIRLSDRELRGAVWLARHLLELVEPADAA